MNITEILIRIAALAIIITPLVLVIFGILTLEAIEGIYAYDEEEDDETD